MVHEQSINDIHVQRSMSQSSSGYSPGFVCVSNNNRLTGKLRNEVDKTMSD